MKMRFIQHRCNADHFLLEHDQSILYQLGLDMESALLNLDKDSAVNVPMCNYNMNDQHLSNDQIIGRLYPVTLTNSDSDKFQRGDEKYTVELRTLSATKSSSDDNHWEKLVKVHLILNMVL